MKLERHQMKTCPDCDGRGEHDDCQDETLHPASEDSVYQSCDECDGEGSHPCKACDGTGDGPDGETFECKVCDGEGKLPCESCDGNGYNRATCAYCQEELDHEYYHVKSWITQDGEIICSGCAMDAGAYKCKTCNGEGELPLPNVKVHGKEFRTVAGSCSCCGARSIRADDPPRQPLHSRDTRQGFDWYVVQANQCDRDGTYYSRLCTDGDGYEGCLRDVLEAQDKAVPAFELSRQEKADVLTDLYGDDTDGISAVMDDDKPGFSTW